ncbi:MAG: prenyltransferase/squalene oxidase repeat-containing protein [Pirellula sp.]
MTLVGPSLSQLLVQKMPDNQDLNHGGSSLPTVGISKGLIDGQQELLNRKSQFWSSVPSWLVSTAIHVGVILILAAWNIEPIKKELKLMLVASESSGATEELTNLAMDDAMSGELQVSESENVSTDSAVVLTAMAASSTEMDFNEAINASTAVTMASITQSIVPQNGLAAQANAAMRAGLSGRSKEARRDMLSKFGGNSDTEKAVSMALKWLAQHQDARTGAWSLAHSGVCRGQCDHPGKRPYSMNAATGLALMCFLGAGQSHKEGEYKETVFKGLGFLIRNMKFQKGRGQWYVGEGSKGYDDMYAHGIATIAMCEAFGMTRDPALLEAAQAGVHFLAYAQNPTTGGWHYAPQGLGDTSVVGWQMMALKSAAMSGLALDINVVRKANVFLDQMSWGEYGGYYHYSFNSVRKQASYNPSTTACAVLCRMYSGVPKDHPSIKVATDKFSKDGPSPSNTYYNYYATQVMKQVGGSEWEKWNVRMRDKLVSTQVTTGHAAGSWFWSDGHSTESGGRLYTTCMATMMLEVYYRYLPLYSEQTEEDVFKL